MTQEEITNCYKIMEISKDGYHFQTLFHGIEYDGKKSRIMPFNRWLEAEKKWAGEGGKKYWTGFHVFMHKHIAEKYFKRFTKKDKRLIVECRACNLHPKESSRGNVFLAEKIMFPN